MIDVELVTRKMVLITGDLAQLQPFAEQDRASYLASPVNEAAVERYLERVIGRMIDINYHLITELGHAPPSDYHVSFTRLAELNVLDADFARQIAACAGLRNRIIHEYNELDPEKVHDALRAALRDIPIYLERVRRFVDEAKS